ncbi:hypothetical protein EGH23_03450 [Halomicroarcula sp. F27]|uniref:Uncharacterized protein n=1 Tax=Haloarcula nitratireducens TaxID=2487749 RepID=A0AAW4P868_9EURY|nr:hypothetical protein [Halomicroarcula nitratireducens]
MDKQRGDPPGTAREEGDDSSLVGRAWARTRTAIGHLSGRVRAWFDRNRRGRSQTTPRSDDVPAPAECPRIAGLPERDRPFTYPARDHADANRADLVSVESGEELTISLPDNPNATITSDVWESVEP